MTEKAQNIYYKACEQFEEYYDCDCCADMLDNLNDLLSVVSDDFLDNFDLSYNTDTIEYEDDELDEYDTQKIHYDDPSVIFTMRHKCHRCVGECNAEEQNHYPDITLNCIGYFACKGSFARCEVNEDNRPQAKLFYEEFCKAFLNE